MSSDLVIQDNLDIRATVLANNSTNIQHIQNLNGLKLLSMNIRSFNKNIDEFLVFLSTFSGEIDVIVLSEAFVTESNINFQLNGYNYKTVQGSLTRNEGVIILYKDTYKAETIPSEIHECTSLCIKLATNNTRNHVKILGIYRTPSVRNASCFIDSLDDFLSANRACPPVICGDININTLATDPNTDNYLTMMCGHGLVPCIDKPTRVEGISHTCIDHIFAHEDIIKSDTKSYIVQTTITDHYTTILVLPSIRTLKNQAYKTQYKNTINFENLKNALELETWENVFFTSDSDEAYTHFIEIYKKHIIEHTTTSVKIKSCKNTPLKPWMTNALLEKLRYRDKLYLDSKNKQYDLGLKNFAKAYNAKLKVEIRLHKNKYYKKEIEKTTNKPKDIWDTIYKITGNTKNKTKTQIPIDAEALNNHFSQIGSNLATAINPNAQTHYPNMSHIPSNPHAIFLNPTSENEVIIAIKKLNGKAAAGNDNIRAETVKKHYQYIAKPLAHVINQTLETGNFPKQLKQAIITPIFKEGDEKLATNYRPISVLPVFSKVLERIIFDRIVNFLVRYNLMSKKQFGFTENTGVNDALYDLLNEVYSSLNNKLKCLTIFMDMAKGFDVIPHHILLKKLYKMGFRGVSYDLIKSYLSNRTQITKITKEQGSETVNIHSTQKVIEYGVPQGSLLGPLLFNIYINDLLKLDLEGSCGAYADDTRVTVTAETDSALYIKGNLIFACIRTWLRDNLLTLNLNKTCYIQYNHRNLDTGNGITDISMVEEVKYLGVYIDAKLRWQKHIDYTGKRLRKTIYKFVQLRPILSPTLIKTVYHAIFQSQLSYGIIAWGSAYKNDIDKINVIQRRILKIILRKPRIYSTDRLYEDAEVMDARQLYAYIAIQLTHKNKNDITLQNFNYTTRRAVNIPIQENMPILKLYEKAVIFFGPKMYNTLPLQIRNITSLNKFKISAKPLITRQILKNLCP